MSSAPIAYISYDRYPAPKGASVHITAFTEALAQRFGSLELVTVPADTTTKERRLLENGIEHTALPAVGRNLIERVLAYRNQLRHWRNDRRFQVVHVRSIFEGFLIAESKQDWCDKFIYEVNGLPSIELKYHYPSVADDYELLAKLEAQENQCIRAADLLLTVSPVNAACLIRRGADPTKIRLIPNGVDTQVFGYREPTAWGEREVRALYCGTLASWQGVLTAIDALALYRRDYPARLTIVGDGRPRQRRAIERHCEKQEVLPFVEILEAKTQTQLADLHHQHDVILAPLRPNDRNLSQGCCPLKMLEAMASGTPLIASDMPVTQSLAVMDEHALLVRPGSAKAIKDGMLRLREDPALGQRLSRQARKHVQSNLTWKHSTDALLRAYDELNLV